MTIFNPPKFVTRSLMGAVGLSAIAFSMTAPAAHAGVLRRGFDFWKTPEGGGTVEIPDIEIEPGLIMMDGMSSLEFTIPGGLYVLDGHPTGTMGLEQEQETVVCFDQHGNAVSGTSEHAVQCLPDPNEPDPNNPVEPLEWTDTIVERLKDSNQLSEVGDVAYIPIRMRSVSLVSQDVIQVPFDDNLGGTILKDYLLKTITADDQLKGQMSLTVTEVEEMGNMTIVHGRLLEGGGPSIGAFDQECVQSIEAFTTAVDANHPGSPNFDPDAPKCLGLPVTFNLALKNANDETDIIPIPGEPRTIILTDGTIAGNEEDVFFSFKKTTPEPSTTLGLLFFGLGSVAGLKRKNKAKK
ncbi:MAG: PEP-CTERM sorting domain-containing protein [Crocosphaera sp.]|nr:PEP-CTERM sorting domain-containing protein [Crocosphaera sp.]